MQSALKRDHDVHLRKKHYESENLQCYQTADLISAAGYHSVLAWLLVHVCVVDYMYVTTQRLPSSS